MRSVSPKVLSAISRARVTMSPEICDVCGSSQRIAKTGECFGCHLEKVLSLRFKNIVRSEASDNIDGNGRRYFALEHFHHDRRASYRTRAAAQKRRFDIYYGHVCEECGCNLRDVDTGECRACGVLENVWRHDRGSKQELAVGRCRSITRGRLVPILTRKVDRIVRDIAVDIGEHTYHGFACACGHTARYTLRGQCVSCVKARNAPRKKKPAEAGSEFDHLFD
jgi:hypothetical protein